MTVIAARRYQSGCPQAEPVVLDGQPREPLSDGGFDWVGVYDPTEDEMQRVSAQFRLHPLAVEDALTRAQPPKVDAYEQHTFIVARPAEFEHASDDTLVYGQTAIVVGYDFIVAVRFGSARAHHKLRAKLEKDPEHLEQGPDYVAHALLDYIVDGFEPIVDHVERTTHELEDLALSEFPKEEAIRRIFHMRRQLRRLTYIVGPMEEVCLKLSAEDLPAIDAAARPWFRDVYDHMRRAVRRFDDLSGTLASIVETGGLLEQHRQGAITRQLAAWAAILAVPTAIAGVYGMNFDHMPELHWRYGYLFALGTMAIACTGLWLRFRRIGWL